MINSVDSHIGSAQLTPDQADWAQRINILIKKGLALHSTGDFTNALDQFDRAITQDVGNENIWYYRAQVHMRLQAYESALQDFRQALRLNPTHAKAWHGLGVAKAYLRLYPSAVDSFERAAAYDPKNDKIWYNRGRALLQLAQYEKALESFDRAIALNPQKHHTWYSRALVLAALEDIRPAIASLEQVTRLKPSCHYAWNYKGTLLNRIGQHQSALESFWESLKHRTPNPNAWYGIAASYAQQGDPTAAAIHLQQAVQLHPEIYTLMARKDISFDAVRAYPKIAEILRPKF